MYCNFTNIFSKKKKAFTLIEIATVIVLIGIVASLIIPGYKKLIGTTKQKEAQFTLQSIYIAQNLYFNENNSYADDIKKLNITIPSDAKYKYTLTGKDNIFTATASGNIDSDKTLDKWTITQEKKLKNDINDIYE